MKRRWLLVAVMVVSMVTPLLMSTAAEAAPFPRAQWRGYFTNQCDTAGGDVITGGLFPNYFPLSGTGQPYVESFLDKVRTALNGGGRNRTGAEVIILTMMGYGPGTPKSLAHDAGVLADWHSRVYSYSNNGWVNWNAPFSWTTNTYWQGNNGGGCAGNSNPDDVAWYNNIGSTGSGIEFHQPGTASFYRIRKECGNPVGDLNGLAQANYNVSLGADRNGSPFSVVPGQTYSLAGTIFNAGPANSGSGTLQVMLPGGVNQPCAPDCPWWLANQVSFTGATGFAGGLRTASGIAGVSGTNWFWLVPPMSAGQTGRATLNFTVAPGAAVGSIITFDVYYSPGDLGGGVRHATVQYRVVSQRIPAVVGNNADIHAGGGVCRQVQSSGLVRSLTGGGSMGEYVVSASAASGINGFKSNGVGADSLRVGQNGNYAQVCRPDLLAAANAYYAAGAGYNTIGPAVSDFDVTGKAGVYFYDGLNLMIHGVVSNKLTIVARSGNVIVSGPITLDGAAHAPRDVPSLGVIASNNIDIRAAVTRVDAYLFANGAIDTCSEASVACATATLVVNGFLMARDIAFHRIGPLNTSGNVVSERVTLNPQIYLNPPKLFDASVDDVLLEGQGERQPLF